MDHAHNNLQIGYLVVLFGCNWIFVTDILPAVFVNAQTPPQTNNNTQERPTTTQENTATATVLPIQETVNKVTNGKCLWLTKDL